MKPFILFGALILASCGNGNNQAEDNATNDSTSGDVHAQASQSTGSLSEPMPLAGCYEMTIKQDTATLNLQVSDTTVTGNLVYDWHEKDGNTGTIKGVLRNNIIMADYTFQSEGMTSVREVIFKIQDNTLLQAFGPLVEQGNKVVFVNPSSVEYMNANPFVKVDCE